MKKCSKEERSEEKKEEAKMERKNENRKLGLEGKNFEFFSGRIIESDCKGKNSLPKKVKSERKWEREKRGK